MYTSGEVAIGQDPSADAYDDNDPSALTDFHGALDPYGSWVDDPQYGTIWVPATSAVGADFTPYSSGGHWAYDTDYVWVSDYDWGWAPFHYGRWVYADGRGWGWVPGRVYRGAWVSWGVDDGYGYVGWYPMAPGFLWFGGAPVAYSFAVGPRWAYCAHGDLFAPRLREHVLIGAAAGPIAGHVHAYAATPGVGGVSAGPPPAKLGFRAEDVPHVSGADAAGVARAQQFSRPSTAEAIGARAPGRSAGTAAQGVNGRSSPGVNPGQKSGGKKAIPEAAPAARPAARPSTRGGGHRR